MTDAQRTAMGHDGRGASRSAEESIHAVRSGRTSALQNVNDAIARARANAHLNALISLRDHVPEAEIALAAKKPLAALPIVVKDIIDVKGLPCTAGTPALKDWRPPTDAPVVARLKEAGAIVIGKANLHELSAGITSNNPTFGPVRNPYNTDLIAGGSSGGSGAAVGAGVVAASLGGDTAGSNRIPASLCGCVGFRPTVGRYPCEGVIPLSFTRDTIGIFAKTVGDIGILDAIIADVQQAVSEPGLAGKRLGVPRAYFYENLDRETADVMEAALSMLADAGATLIDTEVSDIAALAGPISLPLIFYETIRDMAIYFARHRSSIQPWQIVDQMAGKVERGWLENELWGNPTSTIAYNDILARGRPAVLAAYRACYDRDRLDALVVPTTPLPASPIGDDETVDLNGRRVSTLGTYLQNTDATALAGMTSISVPAGMTRNGLPVGLNFDGLPGTDGKILALAAAFEAIRPSLPPPKTARS